jgi:hypothetical protein
MDESDVLVRIQRGCVRRKLCPPSHHLFQISIRTQWYSRTPKAPPPTTSTLFAFLTRACAAQSQLVPSGLSPCLFTLGMSDSGYSTTHSASSTSAIFATHLTMYRYRICPDINRRGKVRPQTIYHIIVLNRELYASTRRVGDGCIEHLVLFDSSDMRVNELMPR